MIPLAVATVWRPRFALPILAAILALVFTVQGLGQAQTPATQPSIKTVPAKQTDPASGAAMFKEYCAPCHGLSAKGDGPAAPALKKVPTDLTLLSANNQGKFPEGKFIDALLHGPAAHGSDMPVWGTIFNALNDRTVTGLRLTNLSRYVEGLQRK